MGYTGSIIFIDYQFAVVSKHAVFGFESAIQPASILILFWSVYGGWICPPSFII
jgi:hypothetical protein